MNTNITILKTKALPNNAELQLIVNNDVDNERKYCVCKKVADLLWLVPGDSDYFNRETRSIKLNPSVGRTYSEAVQLFDSYNEYSIKNKITFTSQDIDDLMVSALEGGITYWCHKAEADRKGWKGYLSDSLTKGYSIYLYDSETNERYHLTLEKLIKGIEKYDENHSLPVQGQEIDWCNIDADAADCIVQYALFGEVIYG